MSGHLDPDRMHDLLDGLLEPAGEAEARAHLDGCPSCRGRFEELEETVTALRALPKAGVPPRELWTGIEARMGAGADPVAGARVIDLGLRRRSYSFSLPQLAAAALVVSLLTAGVVWTALSSGGASDPVVAERAPSAMVGAASRVASLGEEGYEATIQDLEAIVAEGRGLLEPETLAALEGALATIDAALAEVRTALEDDPASPLLQRMLVKNQTAKVRVLRQAATLLEARS